MVRRLQCALPGHFSCEDYRSTSRTRSGGLDRPRPYRFRALCSSSVSTIGTALRMVPHLRWSIRRCRHQKMHAIRRHCIRRRPHSEMISGFHHWNYPVPFPQSIQPDGTLRPVRPTRWSTYKRDGAGQRASDSRSRLHTWRTAGAEDAAGQRYHESSAGMLN